MFSLNRCRLISWRPRHRQFQSWVWPLAYRSIVYIVYTSHPDLCWFFCKQIQFISMYMYISFRYVPIYMPWRLEWINYRIYLMINYMFFLFDVLLAVILFWLSCGSACFRFLVFPWATDLAFLRFLFLQFFRMVWNFGLGLFQYLLGRRYHLNHWFLTDYLCCYMILKYE